MTSRIRPAGFCGTATDRAAALRPDGRRSLIDHCGRLNPDAATGFEEYSAQFVKDIPQPDVALLRASAAYKNAYAKATTELAARPKSDVATVCKTLLVVSAELHAREPKPDETAPAAPVPEG